MKEANYRMVVIFTNIG